MRKDDEILADALSYWVDMLNAGKEPPVEEYALRFQSHLRDDIKSLCRTAIILQDSFILQACSCRAFDRVRKRYEKEAEE